MVLIVRQDASNAAQSGSCETTQKWYTVPRPWGAPALNEPAAAKNQVGLPPDMDGVSIPDRLAEWLAQPTHQDPWHPVQDVLARVPNQDNDKTVYQNGNHFDSGPEYDDQQQARPGSTVVEVGDGDALAQ